MKRRTVLILIVIAATVLLVVVALFFRSKPLTISRNDIATWAEETLNRANLPDTNITVVIFVQLNKEAAAKFGKQSRVKASESPDDAQTLRAKFEKQLNKPLQIIAGNNVVANMTTYSVLSKSQLELFFSDTNQLKIVYEALFAK